MLINLVEEVYEMKFMC